MSSRCDIVRDMVAATTCGLCSGGPSPMDQVGPGTPSGCAAGLSPAVCGIPGAANARMALFADELRLTGGAARALEMRDYTDAIRANEIALAAAYPAVPSPQTSVSWPDFERCLWNPAGGKGGPFGNVYFARDDLQSLGMAPTYPLGGDTAAGAVWAPPRASPLPVAVDYLANPDLAAILVFAFLVLLFAALMLGAALKNRRRKVVGGDSEASWLDRSFVGR
jgi:hypothetical protein